MKYPKESYNLLTYSGSSDRNILSKRRVATTEEVPRYLGDQLTPRSLEDLSESTSSLPSHPLSPSRLTLIPQIFLHMRFWSEYLCSPGTTNERATVRAPKIIIQILRSL